MFDSARFKLTTWYLLIITSVSILFSIAFYQSSTYELERFRRMETYRQDFSSELGLPANFSPPRVEPAIDPAEIDKAENRLKLLLLAINLLILGLSGLAGFFLASRTLEPIKEMVEEQNRFITDASHELRTPLTALRSEIEVSLRDKNLKLGAAKKLLESNLEEVNNLQALSDGLINLTQYQRNTIPFEKLSIQEITKEAIRKVSPLAKQKNITIENRVSDLALPGNKQMLTELLVIFLDNAIKYSSRKTKVTIKSLEEDGKVKLIISDQGVGIEKEIIPHLFDRFYRAEKSRTKDTPGYGLGLSIASEIIEQHHGQVKVESKVGGGSKFIVTLPTS
jgi:two-component system, OmpR family, sensor histidine kinase CiaH